MGLYQRGPTWWMSFTYHGQQVRRSTETGDKKVAEKIYRKVMTEVVEGKWFDKLPGDEKTFREMMEKYMTDHSRINKRSWPRDEDSLTHLLPIFGACVVTDVSPRHVNSYKSARRQEGASPATVNRELALGKHAYSLAIREWEWARENPFKMVSMEKEAPYKDRWLTENEERRLLLACPAWLADVVTFGLDTGCRRGEILSLTRRHVALQTRVATIYGQKTSAWRGIPLTARAVSMLSRRYRDAARRKEDDLVFTDGGGNPVDINDLRRDFLAAMKRAEVAHFRFHDLRHTFATRLAQNGVDLLTIQRLLGHTSSSTTERYAHHYVESLRDAASPCSMRRPRRRLSQFYHNLGVRRHAARDPMGAKLLKSLVPKGGFEPPRS